MQYQLDNKTINFWINEAETEIRLWGKKIINDQDQLFKVPDYLLDKSPELQKYKIELIKKLADPDFKQIETYVDIYFDKLFLDPLHQGNVIDDIRKINRLIEKYDFGAVFSVIESYISLDSDFVFKAIKLFKNPLQLEFNLKYKNLLLPTVSHDKGLALSCLQLSPRFAIAMSKNIYYTRCKSSLKWFKEDIGIDTSPLINKYFEIACTKNSDLLFWSYINEDLLFLPDDDNYLIKDYATYIRSSPENQKLMETTYEANPDFLKYNHLLCQKLAKLNPLVFLCLDDTVFDTINISYQKHFTELTYNMNETLSEKDMLCENRYMNDQFFQISKEHSKKLLDKAKNKLPNLFYYLSKLEYLRDLKGFQKAHDLYFHFK